MNIKPKIIVHDVLQETLYSPAQLKAVAIKSFFEWFKEAMEMFDDEDDIVLAVVVSGVELNPEWVDYIKSHSNWKIVCHGWEHKSHNIVSYDQLVEEMKRAKDLLERTFEQEITYMYPPKHKTSEDLIKACSVVGMSVCDTLNKTPQWLYDNDTDMFYFHFWHKKEINCMLMIKEIMRHAIPS